jgi:hypothetical protein
LVDDKLKVEWRIVKNSLEAFGLTFGKKQKWFHAKLTDLTTFKEKLMPFAIFGDFNDFYFKFGLID